MIEDTLELSDFQRRLLGVPEEIDAFAGGGRGGAKSFALALLALRHDEQSGEQARDREPVSPLPPFLPTPTFRVYCSIRSGVLLLLLLLPQLLFQDFAHVCFG